MFTEQNIDQLIENIKRKRLGLICNRHSENRYVRWDFSPSQKCQYSVSAYLYKDGDLEISAKLRDHEESDFWHYPIELVRGVSEEERAEEFSKALSSVLLSPSRIIQERGLFLWHFTMETFNNDKWTPLYGHSYVRWGFSVPKIDGKKRIYEG